MVTALGITREKKALNYAVQEIKQEKLNFAREQNVGNALAGKIAGVQVLGQSAAKFGNPSIRIRGINSLSGNDPLYVVDGTPTDISQVNMDDVENLSVLKGPSATALYGNRASAGVIVITTKRAKAGETRLDINHSTTVDMVSLLPKYQNEYGGGYSQEFETFQFDPKIHPADWASFNGQRILDYSADESWALGLTVNPTARRSRGSQAHNLGCRRLTKRNQTTFVISSRNQSATTQTLLSRKVRSHFRAGFRTRTSSTTGLFRTHRRPGIISALRTPSFLRRT